MRQSTDGKRDLRRELHRHRGDLREALWEELQRRRPAREGYGALQKDLNQRVREAVRNLGLRRDEFAAERARRSWDSILADPAAVERGVGVLKALADAHALVYGIGIIDPWRVVKIGLEQLEEGERSFQQWEPVSWERVREIFRHWLGRRGRQGGRRRAPARDRYLKGILAKEYDELRRVMERFGMAVPSPTALRREIERAWSQKRKALNATEATRDGARKEPRR